ncbi:MAG TPA: OmpA family protein [Pseudoxanthomonas sp.]
MSIFKSKKNFVLSLVLLSACSGVTPHAVEAVDDRRGYSVDPGDFTGVYFKSGKPASGDSLDDSLSDFNDQYALDSSLLLLEKMPKDIPLRVLGFTDSNECSGTACIELSEQRAKVMHEWFLGHGIPKSRLSSPYGFGSARPIGDNNTEEGRARNRRAYISYESIPTQTP